jgi:hypothetical protein
MLLGVVVCSVEIEWHGGHSAARCFTPKLLEAYVVHVNLRPGGALWWRVEDHRLGRAGSVMWKAVTSKVVASAYVG